MRSAGPGVFACGRVGTDGDPEPLAPVFRRPRGAPRPARERVRLA